MFVKKAVVEENKTPCVITGKPSETVVNGDACIYKYASALKENTIPEIKDTKQFSDKNSASR